MALPTASDNEFPKVIMEEVANDGSATTTPAADHRALFVGEDGDLHLKDSSGTVTTPNSTAAVGNMWSMSKSTSQTLTTGTETAITFDTADIDGGGSVVDLANDRFVAPATGFYMAFLTWQWEATTPVGGALGVVEIGGVQTPPLLRFGLTSAAFQPNNGLTANTPMSLTLGDFVTLKISPGGVTGVTARGNAAPRLRTTFTLVRIT